MVAVDWGKDNQVWQSVSFGPVHCTPKLNLCHKTELTGLVLRVQHRTAGEDGASSGHKSTTNRL